MNTSLKECVQAKSNDVEGEYTKMGPRGEVDIRGHSAMQTG